MKHYRIYSLDTGGRIAAAQDIEFTDDSDALDWAQKARHREDMEIWQGSRLVAKIRAGNAPPNSGDRYSP